MNYSHLFVAGTFDTLHAGHRFLLARAFEEGERVTIGLTTDSFVNKFKIFNFQFSIFNENFKFQISNFQTRKQRLIQFLKQNGWNDRTAIIPINDPYEPAASMKDLDAIIVTAENKKRGEEINGQRDTRSLPPLTLIEVPMVAAADGKPISATRMRNGEIDGDGRLIMPESMRSILGKPLGTVLKGVAIAASIERSCEKIIITVGDIATKTLLDAGTPPFLAIIDGKVGRKPFHETLKMLQLQKVKPFSLKPVKSGPGFISREAVRAMKDCFPHQRVNAPASPAGGSTHNVLVIDGEEDLLVLPALIHAPRKSIVYYGQPHEGLVEVVVTKAKKRRALALLEKFT